MNVECTTTKYEKFDKIWILMPIIFVFYVLWMNLAPLGSTEEFLIDVGLDDSVGKARLTGPFERVSDTSIMQGITYRNLTSNLVYFVLEYPFSSRVSEVEVSIRFKDTLLENEGIYLGAKNNNEGSYDWNIIYGNFLENMTIHSMILREHTTPVYLQNIPKGCLVATDINYIKSKENILDDICNKTLIINHFLRGSHTAYIFVKDEINLKVIKRDLNCYEGEDVLKVSIFKGENLVKNMTIPDDGIKNINNELGLAQTASLYISDLKEGVYKIIFESNYDLFTERIEVYPAHFVVYSRVFSIGNNSSIYYGDESESKLYFSVPKKKTLRFLTYHNNAFQYITVNNERIKIDKAHTWFETELENGFYELMMPKSDVIVEGNAYFSFTRDSFFFPFEYTITDIDYKSVKDADLIFSNVKFNKHGEWIIGKTKWDIEVIKIKYNKFFFAIKTPFLKNNRTMPVDWIKIKVIKNPMV